MVNAGWLLVLSFQFSDGHIENLQQTYAVKEYCIQYAKKGYSEYYSSGMDKSSTLKALCRNHANWYEFVNIQCDKAGNCNV